MSSGGYGISKTFFILSKNRLLLMILGSKIFFVEDKYGVKRFRHFQALFIAKTIIFWSWGIKGFNIPPFILNSRISQFQVKDNKLRNMFFLKRWLLNSLYLF